MEETKLKNVVKVLLSKGYPVTPKTLNSLKSFLETNEGSLELFLEKNLDQNQFNDIKNVLQNHGILSFTINNEQAIYTQSAVTNIPLTEITRKSTASHFSGKAIIKSKEVDLQPLLNFEPDIEILWEPEFSKKRLGHIDDFLTYFRSRFSILKSILINRRDLENLISLKNVKNVKEKNVSIIGMITDKKFSSGGGATLTLEDPNCEAAVSVIVPKSNPGLVEEATRLMNDMVIAIKGFVKSQDLVIVSEIILPDIPKLNRTHYSKIPVHVAYLSDIHIGSDGFIEDALENFILFLNGRWGNKKTRSLGENTKYVIFAGDVVDGVGIYPDQEKELVISDIKSQYNKFAEYLEKFPDDVQIIIIPGNHDHVRSAEPQPRINPVYSPELHKNKNVVSLPNPSQVSIHGVSNLLYHCTSLPDIINHIPGLKIEKPKEVMIKMLQARHLAPIWDSKTPIAPEPIDNLVIEKVPDVFHGGHIHINDLGSYNGVKIVNSGTMQNQTSYQKALNITPTPGEVIIINLKSHDINLIKLLNK